MLVAIKIAGNRIVGHQQVKPAVVVDVHKNRSEAVVSGAVGHAGFQTDIREGAIPVVVEQVIAFARQAAWTAHAADAAKLAGTRGQAVSARGGRVIGIELHVARYEEIQQSIVVVVAPGGTGRPPTEGHAGGFGDIRERAVVVVVVQTVFAVIRNVKIRPAIVVVVGCRYPKSPTLVGDSGLGGDVGKGAVVIVVQEHGTRRGLPALQGWIRRAIQQIDVQ